MPAETRRHGRTAGAATVAVLLRALLSDKGDVAADSALSNLGVGAHDIGALRDAVNEEPAERTVGPDLDPSDLDPSNLDPSNLDPSDLDPQLTAAESAETMVSLLTSAGHGGRR